MQAIAVCGLSDRFQSRDRKEAVRADAETALKIQPKSQLPRPIAAVFRRLRGLQNSECLRIAHVGGRGSVIRVVQSIREGRFETHPKSLPDGE
jgi:hypothetical protein